jgi:hypothetical protein
MAQNVVILSTPKGRIRVCMGWDRPLSEFFCTLMLLDATGEEDLEGDDDDALMMPFSFPGGVAQIRECLKERNLLVPEILFEKTELDGLLKSGNTLREFSPEGVILSEKTL